MPKYINDHAHNDLLYPVFMKREDPRYGCRFKILEGGRDAAKSIALGRFAIERITRATFPINVTVIRHNLKDLKTSFSKVLRTWITSLGAQKLFHVPKALDSPIRHVGGSEINFIGVNEQTEGNIKSFEGIDIGIIEEGQYINEVGFETILPTIRNEGSEIWINLNPRYRSDPVSDFIEDMKGHHAVFCIHLTYRDNKFHTDSSEEQRKMDKERMSHSKYQHVWEGAYDDSGAGDILIPYEWLETCVRAFPDIWKLYPRDMKKSNHHTGTDFGVSIDGDGNAHVRRCGPFIMKAYKWEGCPLHLSADKVDEYNSPHPVDKEFFDPIGVGAGYSSHRPQAFPIPKNGQVGGKGENGKPGIEFSKDRYNEDHFLNRGSQLAWTLRMRAENTHGRFVEGRKYIKIKDCLFINPNVMTPRLQRTKYLEQLSQPSWHTDNHKKVIQIEKQPRPGNKSPNLYDATEQSFAQDSEYGLIEGTFFEASDHDHESAII